MSAGLETRWAARNQRGPPPTLVSVSALCDHERLSDKLHPHMGASADTCERFCPVRSCAFRSRTSPNDLYPAQTHTELRISVNENLGFERDIYASADADPPLLANVYLHETVSHGRGDIGNARRPPEASGRPFLPGLIFTMDRSQRESVEVLDLWFENVVRRTRAMRGLRFRGDRFAARLPGTGVALAHGIVADRPHGGAAQWETATTSPPTSAVHTRSCARRHPGVAPR